MTIDLRYGDTIEQMKLIHDKSIDFLVEKMNKAYKNLVYGKEN